MSATYVAGADGVLAAFRRLIEEAEHSVVLQMYLLARNGDQSMLLPRPGAAAHADELAQCLIAKKRARPDMPIAVVLDSNTPADPSRTRRRGELVRADLERAGIPVLTACLWGTTFDPRRRWLPSMNLHRHHEGAALKRWVERQNRWQSLHNVEDHRKNLVIDGGRAGAITSHNFFDPAFDWHENGFVLAGRPAGQLWRGAIAALGEALKIPQPEGARELVEALRRVAVAEAADGDGEIVEHAAIRGRLEALCAGAGEGDELLVATTYFSDMQAFAALAEAARRGARVRVLIDSIHALPLPPLVAWLTCNLCNHRVIEASARLVSTVGEPGSFDLRVHDSRGGAMMHLKTIARRGRAPLLLGGQANFTPNSFSGAWLETDLETREPAVVEAFARHFEELWRLESTRPPARSGALRRHGLSALLAGFAFVGLRP